MVLDAIVADVKDPRDLRSQLLNILLAGSDTISGTLGFLLASLAQYPHIFEKLRNIIIDEFGSFDRPKQITLSKLKNCSYLQWLLYEVLRVYPAVPVNIREAVRDTSLPTGGGPDGNSPVFIPKGHLVAWEVRHHHQHNQFVVNTSTDISCLALDNALGPRILGSRRRQLQARTMGGPQIRVRLPSLQCRPSNLYQTAVCSC